MADDVNQLLLQVDASVELARRNLRGLEGEVQKFQRSVQSSLDKTDGNFDRFNSNVSRSLGQFKGLIAGAFTVGAVVQFGRSVVEISTKFRGYEQALKIVTGSTQAAAAELEYVSGVAERVGFRVTDLTQAYVGLAAASRGTNLEGAKTRDVFEALVSASAAYGLTSEQLSGALLAVQQMISKGTVSAEELRGQLGERLPGAFQVAARAMGITTAELGKLLQKGEVATSDFLPKFAAQLSSEIPAGTRAAGAGFAEMANQWDRLKLVIGEDVGLFDALASGANALANAIASVNAQILGSQRISAGRGFAGILDVLTSSRQTLEQAATPTGRAAQLRNNVGAAQAELRAALAAKDRGGILDQLGAGSAPNIAQLRKNLKAARAELAGYISSTEFQQAKASFKGDFLSDGSGIATSPVSTSDKKTKAPKQTALEKFQDKTDYRYERLQEINDFVESTKEIDLANVRIGKTISFTKYLGESFGEVADIVDRDVRLAFDELIKQQEELQEAAEDFARTFAGAFEDAILSGDLDNALKGLLEDMARLIIRLTIIEPLAKSVAKALSGGGGGGLIGGLISGISSIFGRASGGSVSANKPYIVGEKGRELFVPRMSGTIVPAHKMGGASQIVVSVDARGATDPAMVEAAAIRAVYAAAPAIINASNASTRAGLQRRVLPRGRG